MKSQNVFFRAGVGMIITRVNSGVREVAFFERAKEPGHWQFPQGGMYQGESPEIAMYRELQEETGLTQDQISKTHEVPFLVSYTYPRAVMDSLAATGSHYIGQTQTWFILEIEPNTVIDLTQASEAELVNKKWIHPEMALEEIIDFKRGEYEQLIEYFQKIYA